MDRLKGRAISVPNMKPRIDAVRIHWREDEIEIRPSHGCFATAEVSYQIHDDKPDRRLETLQSGGLWDIDLRYTTSDAYKRSIEVEELDELRDHLSRFGIVVSDQEWDRLTNTTKTRNAAPFADLPQSAKRDRQLANWRTR